MSKILQELKLREYHVSFDPEVGKYQSPNRRHNLRTYFDAGQWEIQNRVVTNGLDWKLTLTTEGLYADGVQFAQAKDQPVVITDGNQIDFIHDAFTEQYINNPDGIRQNFIVQGVPKNANELSIKLGINGMAGSQNTADEIRFKRGSQTLTYSGLKAWDAAGNLVEATMILGKDLQSLWLKVLTEGVTFPLTIDPIIASGDPTNTDALLEMNQASARFGVSVSGAGDVNGDGYGDVIVGADQFDNGQSNEGNAFVFHGSANGLTTTPATTLESNQANASFGYSVSGAGDVNGDGYSDVVVGSDQYDNGQSNEGRVFVYHGSASGISTSAASTLESNQSTAFFGRSVSRAGDVNGDGYSDIIIGADLYDNGETNEGAAFVYHGSASGIGSTVATLIESDQASANMGFNVASAGDVNGDGYSDVIVGVYNYDNGQTNEGAAFIHHGSASGVSSTATTILETNRAFDTFGRGVGGLGDVNGDGYGDVIVGAVNYDNGQGNEGAAYVYHGSSSGLSTSPAVTVESNQGNANMGYSVSSAGDVNGDGYSDAIVSVYNFDNPDSGEGIVYIYHGTASGISSTAAASIESNQSGALLGFNVSSAGDVNGDGYSDIILGCLSYDNGETNEGAAFVYHGSASGLSTSSSNTLEADQASANFGTSVSSAGDVNGDGYNDVIIGAPGFDNGQIDEGAAFIYHGSSNGLGSLEATLESDQAGGELGYSVSAAGDVNGDGYDDVIVGARSYDNGESDEGAAFVYHGSSGGVSTTAASTLEGNQASAIFGWSVSGAGDVNRDGFADVIVGARAYDNGEVDEGVAFVYHGSASGVNTTAVSELEANVASASFGWSVSGAGDVNGDGYGDVVVGARSYSNGESGEGAAFVYLGSDDGVDTMPATSLESDQASASMGSSVSGAGDVNGDGYGDIIVGANGYDNGESNEGAAFIHHGSMSGIGTVASTILESNLSDAAFGVSVSSAGDVNGDGYGDVVVGAYEYFNGEFNEGAAYVFQGAQSGMSTTASAVMESDQAFGQMGWSVSGAGDVNGDGYSDVIVGANTFNNGQSSEGVSFVFLGNDGGGLRRNVQLYNASTTTPIQQSHTNEMNFALGLFAKNPQGRTGAKLVWETQSEGQAFSGTPITNETSFTGEQASFTDLGVSGMVVSEDIPKVGLQTKVRARIKYDPVTSLNGQVFGPWVYPQGYFGSQSQATPLPIELISFQVTPQNNMAAVEWQTASETDNHYFTIERSKDNQHWEEIIVIPGAGHSSSVKSYSTLDRSPLSGTSFYRLKQTDFDGAYSYSDIARFDRHVPNNRQLLVQPNPAKHRVTIVGHSAGSHINVFNINGALVNSKTTIQYQGGDAMINLSRLPAGIYLLKSGQQTTKLVKE